MTLHAVLVTTDAAGGVTITPSPVIVQHGDTIVWFSASRPHEGHFDKQAPTSPNFWKGQANVPSNVLLVNVAPQAPPLHFAYTVDVGTPTTTKGHSEVIVVGP
jgi:hypothetical protein